MSFSQKNIFIVILILMGNFSFCQNENKIVEYIIQKSIDSEEVSKYFHENIAGRSPLVILDNSKILKEIKLYKFGKSVKVLSKDQIDKQNIKAYLEFKYIVTENETASICFTYTIEGIEAKVEFERILEEWKISNVEVLEQ